MLGRCAPGGGLRLEPAKPSLTERLRRVRCTCAIRGTWPVSSTRSMPGRLLSRTLLDTPLVFFRSAEGAVASLADRCPHRFAPLSKGLLCDGGATLQCPYHGLRFDSMGACVHNPHSKSGIPKAVRVDSYAAVERMGCCGGGQESRPWQTRIDSDYREFANAPPVPPSGAICRPTVTTNCWSTTFST